MTSARLGQKVHIRGGGGSSLCDLALFSQGDLVTISSSDSDVGNSPQTIDAGESDPAWTVDGGGRLVIPEDGLYLFTLTGEFTGDADCEYTRARQKWSGTPSGTGSTVPIVADGFSACTFSFLQNFTALEELRPQAQLYESGSPGSVDWFCDVRAVRMCGPVVEG